MASYQDIESRLRTVESKLDFLMKLGSVTKRSPSVLMPGEYVNEQISFLEAYRQIQALGGMAEVKEIKDDGSN